MCGSYAAHLHQGSSDALMHYTHISWNQLQITRCKHMLCRYNPTDVARAAKLLQGGGVAGKSLQPYEAHVPFLLQLKIDLNLAGMGWLHLSQVPHQVQHRPPMERPSLMHASEALVPNRSNRPIMQDNASSNSTGVTEC